MKTWDGWHEGLAGRAKTMVKLIPRVGTNLVDLHHRLILVIPELTDTTNFSVSVTKPNRSQYNIQNKVCLNLNCARDQRNNIWIWSWKWQRNRLEFQKGKGGRRESCGQGFWWRCTWGCYPRCQLQLGSFERQYRRRHRRRHRRRNRRLIRRHHRRQNRRLYRRRYLRRYLRC